MVGYKPFIWPGGVALLLTPGLAIIAVSNLLLTFLRGSDSPVLDTYYLTVLEFTVTQALLSTLLSVVFALPVTCALARRGQFLGRNLIITLFGLPLVVPVIVSVFGVIAIWGHNGLVSEAITVLGLQPLKPIFGLNGILITHVFFNMPLVVRLLLPAWDLIPGESWRTASATGMTSGAIFRYIELPRIKESLPGISILVFLLCFTSFTTVLVMGGGPQATTLEVAIYHEIRSNFNVEKAVLLALTQVAVCLVISLALLQVAILPEGTATENRNINRPDGKTLTSQIIDGFWISVGGFWILAPLMAIVLKGLGGPLFYVLTNPEVWKSGIRSVMVGLGAGLIAVSIGSLLCLTTRDIAVRFNKVKLANQLELIGSQALIISPVVLGIGLFVILSPWIAVFSYSLILATFINGLITVPFALRFMSPTFRQTLVYHDKLSTSLGLTGWSRIRILEIPTIKPVFVTAFAITAAIATGDLTSVIFFSTGREPTLAVMLYQAMGNYRVDESAAIALLLMVVCLAVYLLIKGVGRVIFRT